MTNLYTGTIKCDGEYVDVANATGVTFTSGSTYQIQFLNIGHLREGDEGEGFLIDSNIPVSYICKGNTLYIHGTDSVKVNIAD